MCGASAMVAVAVAVVAVAGRGADGGVVLVTRVLVAVAMCRRLGFPSYALWMYVPLLRCASTLCVSYTQRPPPLCMLRLPWCGHTTTGIDYIKGHGSINSPHSVTASGEAGNVEISTKRIVVATGSEVPSLPDGVTEIDEKTVLSAKGALCLEKIPKHMVIMGSGVIGHELVRG